MRRYCRRVDHPDQLEFIFVWKARAPAPTPRWRGDCEDGPRPCPHLLCRYHLALDPEKPDPFPFGKTLQDIASRTSWTCALDVAELGGQSIVEVASLVGLSRQRVAQIETESIQKLGEFFKREKSQSLTSIAPVLKKLFAGRSGDDAGDDDDSDDGRDDDSDGAY